LVVEGLRIALEAEAAQVLVVAEAVDQAADCLAAEVVAADVDLLEVLVEQVGLRVADAVDLGLAVAFLVVPGDHTHDDFDAVVLQVIARQLQPPQLRTLKATRQGRKFE